MLERFGKIKLIMLTMIKAHYETLKTEGYTVENLRDIGRIASVMNAVAKVLNS
jgi:lipoyl-dependent peroxiredoxin subunit D